MIDIDAGEVAALLAIQALRGVIAEDTVAAALTTYTREVLIPASPCGSDTTEPYA